CNDLFSFFFSSRRRHTRFSRDWSSDVCSSDLTWQDASEVAAAFALTEEQLAERLEELKARMLEVRERRVKPHTDEKVLASWNGRSEERRVGKEGKGRETPGA